MAIHLIRLASTATVCGIDRTVARGDVTSIRTEADCPACRRSRRTPEDHPKNGAWTPQALGITR